MNLYWLESENRYVHRLSDIPKGQPVDKREVPTDLNGLMGVLNDLHAQIVAAPEREQPAAEIVPEREQIDSTATVQLARMDNPGVDVDAIVETIATSKGYALRRYAGAVAIRFMEMEKK